MRAARALSATAFALTISALAIARGAAHTIPSDGVQRPPAGEFVDLNGQPLKPFEPARPASVIFFIATDCPISNSYAPEIQSICRDYQSRGVSCLLAYEDLDLTNSSTRLSESVRKHLAEFRYAGIPAAVDSSRAIARRAKATVTPQAVVVDHGGKIRYRGRIDNFYAALGTTRRQVTEHDLRTALDSVLSGRAVAKAETEALGCYIVDPAELRK